MNESAPQPRRWPIFASVFFASFTVLAFEVSLTRIFSVLFRYHYAFLAVSGAVCGLGLGGFAWHLLGRSNHPAGREVGWAGLLFALLIPASISLLFGTPLSGLLAAHLWAAFVPLLPFAFAGAFLAEIFRQRAAESGRIYQADLTGAGLAAVLVVPLISLTGTFYLAFLLGALAALGAACWARYRGKRGLQWACLVSALCLLASWPLAARSNFLRLRPLLAGAPEVAKPMLRDLADPAQQARIIDSDWSAYARTDLVRYNLPEAGNFTLQIFTDGETPTPMIPFDGNLGKVAYLRNELPFLAYALSPGQSLLSIGPGGGMDFLLGALAGFREMKGVEINSSLVRMMEHHRHINGNIYHRPGVSVSIEDGRSFVRRSRREYDLIICALTQTATTGNVGLALVESYIHTREAFADYFRHLSAKGRYAFVTQSEQLLLRAAFTAIEVMRKQGTTTGEACRHLLALALPDAEAAATPYRYLLVWKKSPLSSQDLALAKRAVAGGFAEAVFVPGMPGGHPLLAQVAQGEVSPEEVFSQGLYEAGIRLDLRPASDERPFFLDLSFGIPAVLKGLLIGSFGVAVLYTGILLLLPRRREPCRAVPRWLIYFSALGVGFMLVEIPLAQKFILFLGHPTLSLAVILFYLLIGASLGSRLSQAWPSRALPRRVALTALFISGLAVAYVLFLSRLLDFFLPWPLAARLLLPALFLLPLGIALGIPFPSGLRMLSLSQREEIPWMWGINGLMSVVGSTGAAAGAKIIGFNGCLLCAAAIYAGLLLCLRHLDLGGDDPGGLAEGGENG